MLFTLLPGVLRVAPREVRHCELPRDISGFELQPFFTFSKNERAFIEARRSDALKLSLALHIRVLRITGRLLDALPIVPPALWRHLSSELGEGVDG